MQSVVSYPDRGPWGKSSWRGNTSGHVIVDLIRQFKPKLFVDVCEGSGTSGDVCREFDEVDYVGLDLFKGNDFTRDFVLNQLPRPADICWSHPPYGRMIEYSGKVWGAGPVEGDTSLCDVDAFLEKSQVMLLNQREATRSGGVYATLIGDMKKAGRYTSFQSDFIQMMPKSELLNLIIKVQHNMLSNRTSYNGSFIPIGHEYLLLWRKSKASLYQVCWDVASEAKRKVDSTWRSLVRMVMMILGEANLERIYDEVMKIAGERIANNRHWKAKIRQVLQAHHRSVSRGVWAA